MNQAELAVLLCWLVALFWLIAVFATIVSLRRQRFLPPATPAADLACPLVSILIPARNEAGRDLGACVESILAQDYGHFEIIAVDDRSLDETGAVLRAASQRDPRLRVIHGAPLPPAWLGKPWAMRQALDQAGGEWILATDADIIYAPDALRAAMAHARAGKYDALTLIPHFDSQSFWERVFIPTWAWRMLLLIVLGGINNRDSVRAKGMGGFFLTRRAALRLVDDYQDLRNDVVEDMTLAARLKQAGLSVRVDYAPAHIRTRMYRDFRDLWESCSRNWYALVSYSAPLAILLGAGSIVAGLLAPLMTLGGVIGLQTGCYATLPPYFTAALTGWIAQLFLLALINRRNGVPALYALAAPLGFALNGILMLHSMAMIETGRGVVWKGRRIYEDAGLSSR
ncbi:MAG: glycosyltransferase [Blastocatellia bacterium]